MLGAGAPNERATALRCGFAAAVAAVLLAGVAHATDIDVPVSRAPQTGIVGWGGWIFYPSVILGAVYDDNVYRSQTNRVHDWGTRIIPSFTGEFNDGIHRTTIYGTADARFYSENRQGDAVERKGWVCPYLRGATRSDLPVLGRLSAPGRPVHGRDRDSQRVSHRQQQQCQQSPGHRVRAEGFQPRFRRAG